MCTFSVEQDLREFCRAGSVCEDRSEADRFIPVMPEEKLLFSSSLSALMRTPKKSTREKRIGNRLPMIAICFSFIFSSVLSSLQGYGFSLWSAGSSGRSASAEPLSCGLWCHSGVFPAIPLFLHSAYVLSV